MAHRERTIDIHLRVTPREKRQLARQAKRSGMSLSSYLRRVGVGNSTATTSPAVFRDLYHRIAQLRSQAPEGLSSQLDDLARQLLAAYTGGDAHGDDQDLAYSG